MKIFLLILSFLFLGLGFWINTTFAGWNSSPTEILNGLKDDNVQNTALDNAVSTSTKWVKSTLSAIKQSSTGYLQWLAYIGLWIALILIIYNGIRLLISGITGSDEVSKFKKRFISLVLWVVIITSWYIIIKFVISILGELF